MTSDDVISSNEWYDEFQSSNVEAFRYDAFNYMLQVRFKDNISYTYFDVPVSVVKSFYNARSKGRFVWYYLRDIFNYSRSYRKGSKAKPQPKWNPENYKPLRGKQAKPPGTSLPFPD